MPCLGSNGLDEVTSCSTLFGFGNEVLGVNALHDSSPLLPQWHPLEVLMYPL